MRVATAVTARAGAPVARAHRPASSSRKAAPTPRLDVDLPGVVHVVEIDDQLRMAFAEARAQQRRIPGVTRQLMRDDCPASRRGERIGDRRHTHPPRPFDADDARPVAAFGRIEQQPRRDDAHIGRPDRREHLADRMVKARQHAGAERDRQDARPVLQMFGRTQQCHVRRDRPQPLLEVMKQPRDARIAVALRAVVRQREQHRRRVGGERGSRDVDRPCHRRGRIGVRDGHRAQDLHGPRAVDCRCDRACVRQFGDHDVAAKLRETFTMACVAQYRAHGMAGVAQGRHGRLADVAGCTEDHEHDSLLRG